MGSGDQAVPCTHRISSRAGQSLKLAARDGAVRSSISQEIRLGGKRQVCKSLPLPARMENSVEED